MSNAVYPVLRGLTFTVNKRPTFGTIVQGAPGGQETRVAQIHNPMWEWTLIYNYLLDDPANVSSGVSPYTDYSVLSGFYAARSGQFDDFLFTDPADQNNGQTCYFGPAITGNGLNTPPLASGTPNISGYSNYAPAKLQLVTDGAGNWYTPLQVYRGGEFYEDVTDIVSGSLALYANGSLETSGSAYSILGPGLAIPGYSFVGLYALWLPAALAPPAVPVLSSASGGTLAAATYYVTITYVSALGETTVSQEAVIAVAADNLLVVDSPAAMTGATGWNVYVSSTEGAETKQNSAALTIGNNWTEPTGGLISGSNPPASNNTGGKPSTPITAQFTYYYRVRFASDQQDFEWFMDQLWTIGGKDAKQGAGYLKLKTSRPYTSP